jgi:Domain of unknown function (DUF4276)
MNREIKIGIVGESPNDTSSIIILLKQKLSVGIIYITLIKNMLGAQLDGRKAKSLLKREFEKNLPDIVVFIRDADGLDTDKQQIMNRKEWYNNMSKELNSTKILLLNIYELEALVFADISAFNAMFNTELKGDREVTRINQPKKELIYATDRIKKYRKTYQEKDCARLFEKMNIDTVIKNCKYFAEFYDELTASVKLHQMGNN